MAPTRRSIAAATFVFWVLVCGQAHAEVRALLIGVDRYDALPAAQQLKAPTHDVRRLRAALIRRGLDDDAITRLTGRVTRTQMDAVLDRAERDVATGDVLVLYYSGHGGRRSGGTEADGLEEGLVLSDARLDRTGAPTSGFLPDQAILARLDRLRRKGVQTWLIVDACHGAGLVRGRTIRKGLGPTRPASRNLSHSAGIAEGFAGFFAAAPDAAALETPISADGAPASDFTLALVRALDAGRTQSLRDLAAGVLAQDGRLGANAPRPEFVGQLDVAPPGLSAAGPRRFAVRASGQARLLAGSEEGVRPGDTVMLEAMDGAPLGVAQVTAVTVGEAQLDAAPTGAVAARIAPAPPHADVRPAARLLAAVQALGGGWQGEGLVLTAWRHRPPEGCAARIDPDQLPDGATGVDLMALPPFIDCDVLIVEARNNGVASIDVNLLYAAGAGQVVSPTLFPTDTPRVAPGEARRIALRLRKDAADGDRLVVVATPVRSRFPLDLRYLTGPSARRGETDDARWFAAWLKEGRLRAGSARTPEATAALAIPVSIRSCDGQCQESRAILQPS